MKLTCFGQTNGAVELTIVPDGNGTAGEPSDPVVTRLRHHHGEEVAQTRPHPRRWDSTPTPEAVSAHLTRSQCFYRKLHLSEDDYDATVLVPQCTVTDTALISDETSEDQGEPVPIEQNEGQMRPITQDNPQLDEILLAKLHRIVGTQIVNEGHCYLLSASDNALATKTTPNLDATPKESRQHRQAGQEALS